MSTVAENESIKIDRMSLGPYGTNCYILSCVESGESVLVDTPADAPRILKGLEGTTPKYIFITHNHMDHLGAFKEVSSKLQVPVAAHPLDADGLPSKPDILLGDGDRLSFGDLTLEVFHTPGHTPGSVCLYLEPYLISGDTIFPGGPGKTGSPDKLKQIIDALKKKIFVLPEATEIFPGHGAATRLSKERAEFDIFSSKPRNPQLCGDVLWLSS